MAARTTTRKTPAPVKEAAVKHVGLPKVSVEVEIFNDKGEAEKVDVEFTSLRYMPLGLVRSHRDNFTAQLFAAVEWAMDAKTLAIVDKMPSSQLFDLYTRMQTASEVEVGESDGSSTTS